MLISILQFCRNRELQSWGGENIPPFLSSALFEAEIENCLREAAIPSATLAKSWATGLLRPMAEWTCHLNMLCYSGWFEALESWVETKIRLIEGENVDALAPHSLLMNTHPPHASSKTIVYWGFGFLTCKTKFEKKNHHAYSLIFHQLDK